MTRSNINLMSVPLILSLALGLTGCLKQLEVECVFYVDADGDGYGDPALLAYDGSCGTTDTGIYEFYTSGGYAANGDDCNDADADINPDADEECDGVDNDCDNFVDAADPDLVGGNTYYADDDHDGFGNPTTAYTLCTAEAGFVSDNTDCDDNDNTTFPGAVEDCDGIDNDCDGSVPAGEVDADTDGWRECAGDCNDGDAAIHPGAFEDCASGVDSNCDGFTGDGDNDGDGSITCYDCNDGDAAIYPGATEQVGDEVDQNCDGQEECYSDADGDGYGDESSSIVSSDVDCDDTGERSSSDPLGDCDDADPEVGPGEEEICDDVDNDCDGTVDEASAVDASTWYADDDSDSYGDPSSSAVACDQPTGYESDNTDCDDSDAEVNPGATEDCADSRDLDCSGSATDAATDADSDGYVDASCDSGDDCDDSDANTNPGATETHEVWDLNCNDDPYDGELSVTLVDATNFLDDTSATLTNSGGAADLGNWAVYTSVYGSTDSDLLASASFTDSSFTGTYNVITALPFGSGTDECAEVTLTGTASGDDYVVASMARQTSGSYLTCVYHNDTSSLVGCASSLSSSGELVEYGTLTGTGSDSLIVCWDDWGGDMTHWFVGQH